MMLVFVIRNNFNSEDEELINEIREDMKSNYQVGILVDQEYEKADWEANKDLPPKIKVENSKSQFISRWLNMEKAVIKEDVLVVSTYLNSPNEIFIGILPKGSKRQRHERNNDLFFLQLKEVEKFSTSEYPVLLSLLPQQTTISPYYKKSNLINALYSGEELPLKIENLSNRAVEIMCSEWMRNFAERDTKIHCQISGVGGSIRDIDIYGLNNKNEEVVAQVTTSTNRELINKKAKRIAPFKNKLLFSGLQNENSIQEIPHVSIQKVLDEMIKAGFKTMIEKMIKI